MAPPKFSVPVFGMPRAAKEAGAAQCLVPLERMGGRVEREWRRLAAADEAGNGVVDEGRAEG